MTQGVYNGNGALRVTLNDTTTKGMMMPDGSLRVTNAPGTGIMDASGALRISAAGALTGVMSNTPTFNYSNAQTDGMQGVYAPNGALRMDGVASGSVHSLALGPLLSNLATLTTAKQKSNAASVATLTTLLSSLSTNIIRAKSINVTSPVTSALTTSGWTPLSLTNVIGFYRADVGVTQSSGNVSAWADQSPQAQNLTVPGNAPVYSSTGFNTSYPGITVTLASTEYLANNSFALNTKTCSFFVLFKDTSNTANLGTLSFYIPGNNNDFSVGSLVISVAQATARIYSGGDLGASLTATYTNPSLLGVTFDGAHAQTYLNSGTGGSAVSYSTTVGQSGTSNTLWLGARNQGSGAVSPWSGTYAYVLVTAATMSTGDIANLRTWTNANWGTSF